MQTNDDAPRVPSQDIDTPSDQISPEDFAIAAAEDTEQDTPADNDGGEHAAEDGKADTRLDQADTENADSDTALDREPAPEAPASEASHDSSEVAAPAAQTDPMTTADAAAAQAADNGPATDAPASDDLVDLASSWVAATASDAEKPAEDSSFGDDPAPLPRGFRVVDGTAGNDTPVELVSDGAPAEETPLPTTPEPLPVISAANPATPAPAVGNSLEAHAATAATGNEAAPSGAAGLLASVGTFLSTGADAVRQVNAAKKAHDAAREELAALTKTIRERTEELEHRQEFEANYSEIVGEHTARLAAQNAIVEQAKSKQLEISQVIATKNEELARIEAEDAKAVKHAKKTADKAEDKERAGQDSMNRLQKRLDDARATLTAAEAKREQATEEAKEAVTAAANKLAELRAELAELQRNPSANPANYSVRTDQLQGEISDAIDAQRAAQNAVPALSEAAAKAIEQAHEDVIAAQKPVDKAQEAYRVAHNDAEVARAELKRAQKLAAERKRDMREIIEGHEKALREQERTALEAEQAALQEQAILDEAEDIHTHPEATQALAAALAANHAEADDLEAQVEALAAAEHEVREQTKGSRLKFTAAIAAGAVLVLLILLAIFIL